MPADILRKYADISAKVENEIELQTAIGRLQKMDRHVFKTEGLIRPLLSIAENKFISLSNRIRAIHLIGAKDLSDALNDLSRFRSDTDSFIGMTVKPEESELVALISLQLELAIFRLSVNEMSPENKIANERRFLETTGNHLKTILPEYVFFKEWMESFPSSKAASDLLLLQTNLLNELNDFFRKNFVDGMILAAKRQYADRAFEILSALLNQLKIEGDWDLKKKLREAMLIVVQIRIQNCAADLKSLLENAEL